MSTYPSWTAGTKITAQKLNDGQPHYIDCSTTPVINNSTTATADTELIVPVEANAMYEIEMVLAFFTTVNCDVRTDWDVPAGASGLKHCMGATSTAADFTSRDSTNVRIGSHGHGTDVTYQLDTSGNTQWCLEKGIVTIGATSGNITLRWAQGTATVGDLSRSATSFIRYKRVA